MKIKQICRGLAVVSCASSGLVAGLMAVTAMSEPSFVSPIAVTPRWIAGHPFTAEEVETVSVVDEKDPSPARSYKYYRDAEGRTLTVPAIVTGTAKQKSSAYNPNLTEIVDPVAKYWYVVDAARKVVHRSQMPSGEPAKPARNPNSSSLGSRLFFGVQANGSRVAPPNGTVTELWFSEDLQLAILSRISSSKATFSKQIVSLQLGDPAPALFQIPGGYTLVNETGPFTVE